MRAAIAGLHAETNTFLPRPGALAALEGTGLLRGAEIFARHEDSGTTIAGYLQACREAGTDVVPLVYADLLASYGAITSDAFEAVAGEIVRGLREHGPFDVVLLAQHGAAVAVDSLDADGELMRRVRSAVGPDVTVAATLDLHANVTARMVESVDVCVAYRENPHRDPFARAVECAALALRHARGELRPAQSLVRLPMVVPILGGRTDVGPMREVMEEAARIAEEHALVSHSVFHGFGYADVPEMGSAVLAVADGDPSAAAEAARLIAERLWQARELLLGDALPPPAAVAEGQRRAVDGGPVVILDVGDNIGGGAPGSSTILLAEARATGAEAFVATLCDAAAVERAREAGEGAEVELDVGAASAVSVGPRLRLRGRVARVSDGRFEDAGVTHGGLRHFDGGSTVRLLLERRQELILTSRAVPTFTPEQLRAVDIEPRTQRTIVAKGVVAPRAGYASVTDRFVLADTPGITAADLSRFEYRHRRRPLWPLERDARLSVHSA